MLGIIQGGSMVFYLLFGCLSYIMVNVGQMRGLKNDKMVIKRI